jgi:hypothetical protein
MRHLTTRTSSTGLQKKFIMTSHSHICLCDALTVAVGSRQQLQQQQQLSTPESSSITATRSRVRAESLASRCPAPQYLMCVLPQQGYKGTMAPKAANSKTATKLVKAVAKPESDASAQSHPYHADAAAAADRAVPGTKRQRAETSKCVATDTTPTFSVKPTAASLAIALKSTLEYTFRLLSEIAPATLRPDAGANVDALIRGDYHNVVLPNLQDVIDLSIAGTRQDFNLPMTHELYKSGGIDCDLLLEPEWNE